MIGATTVWADAPASEARGENGEVNVEEDRRDRSSAGGEGGVKRCDLRRVAWKAIKDHALRSVRLGESCADHADRHLIRDELSCINERRGGATEFAPRSNLRAEEVARGHMCGASGGGECLRLRPLPCARGAEKDQDHLIKPS